ncbi:MAG: permease prefix domain 1-containing protein [Clostridium sp.]|uniref:permease prefix domain 1-containing protein n=1 Tax=Clostridium sp. TaxID=1506 RepID=UPI0025C429FA|nr:permease prefix domain 1-containing protein [Clostridium sp.]MCH3964458.1 permease prefix domain 1-containing protein [Clostridium sp.]MCI1715633.1 permease prefix domain 1-containing protein [Clostridium sp.]MCI1799575.1 permease prefix domain 1-containing protein [Clostridium sp.]MCI1813817.1 permease prefix domain 1-containing protein [Clostridium sp.]MCI1870388.1 permease prefix domain 1-containing protein [Clostridium sp.]
MHEKLRKSVEELFQNAPKTNRANELKEELLANLTDKYDDLVSSGKNEEDAFKIAISSIGDVDELIEELKNNDVFNYKNIEKQRKKSAILLSVSVGLYIMSVVVLILLSEVFMVNENVAASIMLTIIAVATGIIIYSHVSRPRYVKSDDTIVEEFKEWKSLNNTQNEIIKSIKSIMWLFIVAVYFVLSFVFGAWAYSWIIFIIGAAVEKIIVLSFKLKE